MDRKKTVVFTPTDVAMEVNFQATRIDVDAARDRVAAVMPTVKAVSTRPTSMGKRLVITPKQPFASKGQFTRMATEVVAELLRISSHKTLEMEVYYPNY